ncbi:hypothetical protein [Rossellomorea marisflavi]|uniref:hypothetical protein n=1 Tax=Rossellomorea marisflavi TaxID=189381 RepID=UPI00064E5DC4|nr:hypothetical protein [Rossellomorea marisflavi]KMK93734.1 hypothetical protein VL03_12760 [Rossellomorea marisflavi]
MNYTNDLIDHLIDSNKWPDFPAVIWKLIDMAEKEYEKGTIEGFITSVILFQQIAEESIKLLIRYSNLVQKAQLWPIKLDYSFVEGKLMFGQILSELKRGIDFKNKKKFVKSCTELNQLRIKIVHKLVKIPLDEIEKEAACAMELFRTMINSFFGAEEDILFLLSDLTRNINWKEFYDSTLDS